MNCRKGSAVNGILSKLKKENNIFGSKKLGLAVSYMYIQESLVEKGA